MNITKENEYEIYKILDVSPNITDRELEITIINKLKESKFNKELYKWYSEIYDYFFTTEDEEEVIRETMTTQQPQQQQQQQSPLVTLTNPLNYAKDNMNPLLNQTIKKIISIDSQYRDGNYPYSTNFTFDLSEPLRDVVSIKLYSIQIPYTWYTINNDYGSNFFYLKATSPGLNNGNHDYIVDISAGNYSASNLVLAVNNSLIKNKTLYTDISFGTTEISYNTYTSTATITIDITKLYNETNYYVYFPSFINPITNTSPVQRAYTIPSYLGYDVSSIPINIIYSNNSVLPLMSISAITDKNNSIYVTDNSNNYFNIIQYLPTITYDTNNNAYTTSYNAGTSTIIQTITINIGLSSGTYSRNQIQTSLNSQLQNNNYLYGSSITRIDRSDANYSYYAMTLRLNQTTTQNIENMKIAVQFPNEDSYNYPVWTGNNSCFYFDASYVEVSNLLAETNLLTSSYIINNNPVIYLKCIETGYVNGLNDYYIDISNSPNSITGYTLNDYLSAINQGFISANSITTNNDLNPTISGINLDKTTSTPIITFDLNHIFNTSNYEIDFTNSVLNYFFGMTYDGSDLSGNLPNSITGNVFTGYLTNSSNYSIPINTTTLQTIPNILFTVYPQTIYGNANASPFIVYFNYTLSSNTTIINGYLTYINHFDIQTDINNSISIYTDGNGDSPLLGTQLTYDGTLNNTYITNFTINILKIITQTGYEAILYDLSGGTTPYYGTDNSWTKYLFFNNTTYLLDDYGVTGEPYSQISGTLSAIGETIELYDNSNNFFYLKPIENTDGLYTTTSGQYSNTNYNDIRITIPAGIYTSSIQLLTAINTVFTSNPLTLGSYINTITLGTQEYVTMRLNINKTFTANDYSIVFFDTVSFVKCYAGDTSIRNATWDTTLGWILGFQAETIYPLSNYLTNNIAIITGETSVNVNLYNYLLISLDDYNQNRLNDGVVTITKNQISIPLPSYASMSNYTCDISGNTISSGSTNVAENNLTINQIYSLNQILNAQQSPPKTYTTGPFVKDVFGIVPLKVSGLQNGQSYVETSGQLQQQERLYFGPVNIPRMSIKLYNDKGTILDLNGVNWSFSFLAEQLYQKQKI